MNPDHNPQAAEMGSDAMVANLVAQATAMWPQEAGLFARYEEDGAPKRILDLACGTGEITVRLGERYPESEIVGVDLDARHLGRARDRCGGDPRFVFRMGDAYELDTPDGSYDLVVCRSLLQSVPEPARVFAEMARVTRSGGWVHALVEDYGMLHAWPDRTDLNSFWHTGPVAHARGIGIDLLVGRKAVALARDAGLTDLRLDYLVVDTLRVDREVIATIFTAWRDAFAEPVSQNTSLSLAEVRAHFEGLLAATRDRDGYVVWHVPIVSGRKA